MVNIICIGLISISMGLVAVYYFMCRIYVKNDEIMEKMESKITNHIYEFDNAHTKVLDRRIYSKNNDTGYY